MGFCCEGVWVAGSFPAMAFGRGVWGYFGCGMWENDNWDWDGSGNWHLLGGYTHGDIWEGKLVLDFSAASSSLQTLRTALTRVNRFPHDRLN